MPDPKPADTATLDELDLSPRDLKPPRRWRWPAVLVAVGLLAVFGFVLVRGLTNATLFFYNADEAVAKKASLGDHRFRLQGVVMPGSVHERPTGVAFTVTWNGVEVPVDNTGAPPQLFRDSIPVVVEGHWSGDTFDSDQILVKHTEVYDAKHPDRVKQANDQVSKTSTEG
jgi:cytochrome c-type biogenesis protein CcmE